MRYYLVRIADAGSVPDSTTICKGSDFLRALSFWCAPRVARGSGDPCCGWPSAEARATGHFLGQRRLFSPFGLRVGADRGLAKSTTYAHRFIVNQDHRSSIKPGHDLPLGGPFGLLQASRTLAAKMSTMTSKKKIAADLQSALSGQSPLSIDLYVEVLADYEDELKASLDKDADDALLCMLADDGDVAMMVIDWDGSIYRNENALKKLQAMWRNSFDTNVQTLVPILSDHISQKNLGVAGIKWLPASTD